MSGMDDYAFTTRIVAASTTVVDTDFFIIVAAPAANVVVTLPQASTKPAGRPLYVARDNTATFTVTVTPNAADKVDSGTAGVGVAVGAAATAGGSTFISDGVSNWYRVGNH